MLKLRDVDAPLANFFASGVLRPAREARARSSGSSRRSWPSTPERFDAFFALLPRDTEAALALAREHDAAHARAAPGSTIDAQRPLRHAVEIRHPSFVDPAFIALLRRHSIALVVADTAGHWPLLEDLTADFVYVRLHGDKELYASGYGDAALDRWAERIGAWRARQRRSPTRAWRRRARRRGAPRRDVYCYFDNDVKVHAPYDAAHLAARLGACRPASTPATASCRRRGCCRRGCDRRRLHAASRHRRALDGRSRAPGADGVALPRAGMASALGDAWAPLPI